MNWDYYKQYIRGKETTIRCDPTPIFENPEVFHNLINDMLELSEKKFNKIAAIDALGFILGSALAFKTQKPLILIRKEGKFPYPKKFLISQSFTDYTKKKKGFEIKKDSINKGDKILIIDEWIETGAQVKSAIKLIKKSGGNVVEIIALNADLNKKTKELFENNLCKAIKISKH
jgi:adenine phosphoribosyltransferase